MGKAKFMGKAESREPPDAEVWNDPGIAGFRSYLQYARRGAPASVPFTLSADVGDLYGHSGRGIASERDLIEYALAFANGDTNRSVRRKAIRTGQVIAASQDGSPLGISVERTLQHDADAIEAIRARYRQFLGGVVADRKSAADLFMRSSPDPLAQMWSLPEVHRSPNGLTLTYHQVIFNRNAFDALVSVLLLDESRAFGRDLCQCSLPSCGRFFLVKRPVKGRPRRDYCGDDCMLAAHNKGSKERKRKAARARRGK